MAEDNNSAVFDANVLLETLFMRKNASIAADLLHQYAGRSYISALSSHLVVYFGQKYYPLNVLKEFLADFQILTFHARDTAWAFDHVVGKDFEDALQISIALHADIPVFYTFDDKLAERYQSLKGLSVQLIRVTKISDS